MKILKEDNKNKEFKFIIENDNDLWNLNLMIDKDDIVKGIGYRKININNTNQLKKQRFFFELIVEKTEYKGNILKVLGITLNEIEDVPKGSYQSINITISDEITLIKKNISAYFKEKLLEVKTKQSELLIALFDRTSIFFAKANNSKVEIISKEEFNSGKGYSLDNSSYDEFIKRLNNLHLRFDNIIIGCPFVYRKTLEEKLSPELKQKIVFTTINSVDETGIKEVLTSEEIKNQLSKLKISNDLIKIQEILTKLSKNDKIVYGFNQVKNAINLGAVQELIISEKHIIELKNKDQFQDLDSLMRTVENYNGTVTIISSEASQQLDALGGVIAFTRYQL